MRGKVNTIMLDESSMRITPAYAGKSKQRPANLHAVWDHPRLCGEKSSAAFAFLFCAGSPPPMRGKVSYAMKFAWAEGITPAYAGKSL